MRTAHQYLVLLSRILVRHRFFSLDTMHVFQDQSNVRLTCSPEPISELDWMLRVIMRNSHRLCVSQTVPEEEEGSAEKDCFNLNRNCDQSADPLALRLQMSSPRLETVALEASLLIVSVGSGETERQQRQLKASSHPDGLCRIGSALDHSRVRSGKNPSTLQCACMHRKATVC